MFLESSLDTSAENTLMGIDLLRHLVEIDSQVGNTPGITHIQKTLKEKLLGLGFDVEFIENKLKKTAPLLVAKMRGSLGAKTISFIGHSDVVTNPKMNPFRIEGDKFFGAGVADNKGGLVVCLLAIEQMLSKVVHNNLNINVIISPNEETGSIGFHHVFSEIGRESDFVFGLEPALQCGSLITSRNGNRWYSIKTQGISAHAGRFGQDHINAAHALSLIIGKMQSLNDEPLKRRVNVGSFSGGNGGFNTICGEAEAKLDVRFSSFECRDYLHKKITDILEETSLECPYSARKSHNHYILEDDCPPLTANQKEQGWFREILETIEDLEGRKVEGAHAGGAADINYFAHPGLNLMDGLGPVGGGLHTAYEYIEKDSLWTRAVALERFLIQQNNTHTTERSILCRPTHYQN